VGLIASRAQRLLYRIDRARARRWWEARRRLGLAGDPRLMVFDGWSGARGSVVRGRVVEPPKPVALPPLPSRAERVLRRTGALYARFAAVDVPGAQVEVRCGARVETAATDAVGVFDLTVPVAGPVSASVRVPAEGLGGEARLFRAGPDARYVVVSDIDDTILETDLTNPLRRYAQLLTSELETRLPFDGVAALYQALTAGGAPMFYLSNSPWNLHREIRALLESHRLPRGPLLLRDWGIRREGLVPGTRAGALHKERALRRIAAAYPALPMVLIGDTTRRDAQHYLRFAEDEPGRVAAIYLRRVEGRLAGSADLDGLSRWADRIGVGLVAATSTEPLARDAARRGLIDSGTVADVRAAQAAEAARPEPLEELLGHG